MQQIFERFSATELDNVLHALKKYEGGDDFTDEEIQTSIWLDGKIAPPIDDAIHAIINYRSDLISIIPAAKTGKHYRAGAYLNTFLRQGGFKSLYNQQAANENSNIAAKNAAHQANLATIDAAASAKRSADASQLSAGAAERSANAADHSATMAKQALATSIIAALLALAALIRSFFD